MESWLRREALRGKGTHGDSRACAPLAVPGTARLRTPDALDAAAGTPGRGPDRRLEHSRRRHRPERGRVASRPRSAGHARAVASHRRRLDTAGKRPLWRSGARGAGARLAGTDLDLSEGPPPDGRAQAIVSAVQYALLPQDLYADLRPLLQLLSAEWALALAVVGLGAPLSEELLFRGFLLSALARSRLGFARGALVTTSLWTALHAGYSLAGILEVFTIGLFFSWLLWRTGSLRVPIVCHALYNALIVLVLRYVPLPT